MKIVQLCIAALLVPLALSGCSAASAPSASQPSLKLTNQQLETFAVPLTLRPGVRFKVSHGIPLDASLNRNKISHGSFRAEGDTYTIDRYADGSFEAVSIETPRPLLASHGYSNGTISGCTTFLGQGVKTFSGCTVKKSSAILLLSFTADYQQSSGVGQINRISNWHAEADGGTRKLIDFKIIQKTSGVGPAIAELKVDYTAANGVAESDGYVRLDVPSSGSAYAASNL